MVVAFANYVFQFFDLTKFTKNIVGWAVADYKTYNLGEETLWPQSMDAFITSNIKNLVLSTF